MTSNVGSKAQKENHLLKPFSVMIGEWETKGLHPYLPGKSLSGRAVFEWIEGGAFLLWRSEMREPEFPNGVAIFGSDDATGEFFMLYFDERKISRKYDVSVEHNIVRWQRNSSDFSQRMVLTIAGDGNTMVSKGEMSKNAGSWEPDLELNYSRVK